MDYSKGPLVSGEYEKQPRQGLSREVCWMVEDLVGLVIGIACSSAHRGDLQSTSRS